MARYAEGTTVEVSKSRGEMMELLSRHGATHFGFGTEPDREVIVFQLFGLRYRFEVMQADWTQVSAQLVAEGRNPGRVSDRKASVAAEWRRRWRARLLYLKALLEFAEGDPDEAKRLLMSQLLLTNGQTLASWAAPQVEQMYASGKMPPLLEGGS